MEDVKDPVCGMTIHKENRFFTSSYGGNDYYFCSENCKTLFDEDPEAAFPMKAARDGLMEQERTRSLERMADELAHEMRNPLTSIGGFTRRIYENLKDNDPGKKYMKMVIEDVVRLENIVGKLIELNTLGIFRYEPSNVNEIILDALKQFEEELKDKKVEVRLELTDEPFLILLDKNKMVMAISNLIKNSIEAMEQTPKLLKISTRKRNNYAEMSVSDNGKGIPEDKIKYVFDPFFTTKINGPGLGLTFTQRIIKEHEGMISVESGTGKGTTFTIKLPLK